MRAAENGAQAGVRTATSANLYSPTLAPMLRPPRRTQRPEGSGLLRTEFLFSIACSAI